MLAACCCYAWPPVTWAGAARGANKRQAPEVMVASLDVESRALTLREATTCPNGDIAFGKDRERDRARRRCAAACPRPYVDQAMAPSSAALSDEIRVTPQSPPCCWGSALLDWPGGSIAARFATKAAVLCSVAVTPHRADKTYCTHDKFLLEPWTASRPSLASFSSFGVSANHRSERKSRGS